jgi:hypothetical protein
MGTYTQIAKVGADASARRRHGGMKRSTEVHVPGPPAPYVCPRCDDESAVDTTCGRCDGVRMLARARSVALVRRPSSGEGASVSVVAGTTLVGVPVLTALFMIARGALEVALLAALLTVAIAVVLGLVTHEASTPRRRRCRLRDVRRSSALQCSLRDVGHTPVPVRLDGRLRVEAREHGPCLVLVQDDGARVRVPVSPTLRAYEPGGERAYLEDGERVEIEGHVRRVAGVLEGYRDLGGELALDPQLPSVVWVEG